MNRMCAEVQTHLPDLVSGTLPAWRRRLVSRHARRCADCAGELARQETLAAELAALGQRAADGTEAPPAGLLDQLLAETHAPGLRGRAAVPARGAVSGARPALSAVLLVSAAALGTAAGYAAWRGGRAVRRRSPTRGPRRR